MRSALERCQGLLNPPPIVVLLLKKKTNLHKQTSKDYPNIYASIIWTLVKNNPIIIPDRDIEKR